ncbi:MAG: GNAT family N-acetyltransferase [Alphaproteobacteria bacterium]
MRDVLEIDTERLVLRRPEAADAARLACWLRDLQVSRMTAHVPHPYPPVAAEGWVMLARAQRRLGRSYAFVIHLPGEGAIGGVGVHPRDHAAELGYWIGRPFWGEGFATEAVRGLVAEAQNLGALEAGHFVDNPASGRVLEKAGFVYTGEVVKRFSIARGESVDSRRMRFAAPSKGRKARAQACLA